MLTLPARVGPFVVEALIARGGSAVVYRATQESPIRRTVAVKVMREGSESPQLRRRFVTEYRVLALMQHTNIETVLDAGVTAEGVPWFAMPYIDGSAITTHCDAEALSVRDRVSLFLQVCDGVSHAHAKGIIHRDLKPSNILIATPRSTPTVKIIDFGIAKTREPDDDSTHDPTAHGAFLGTLAYTSPEQAMLGSAHADARSDMFSLGALLHELACGFSHLPVEQSEARLSDLSQFEPRRMSERITSLRRTDASPSDSIAKHRAATHSALVRALRGDLDAIVISALSPKPAERYASVDALAADLRRWLDGRPVEALSRKRGSVVLRFIREHKIVAITGASTIAIIVVAMTMVTMLLLREHSMSQRLERTLYVSSLFDADDAIARGEFSRARHALDAAPRSLRGLEWDYRNARADTSIVKSAQGIGEARCVRCSPDGMTVAVTSGASEIRLLHGETLAIVRTLNVGTPQSELGKRELTWLAWSADGHRIASGTDTGDVFVTDAMSGARVATRAFDGGGSVGTWIDDSTIAIGTNEGALLLVDASTLTTRVTGKRALGDAIIAVLHHARDPSMPIIAVSINTISAFDARTLAPLWSTRAAGATVGATMHPSGTHIALTYRSSDPATIHATRDGALATTIRDSVGATSARWSPDGRTLWVTFFNSRVTAFDAQTLDALRSFAGSAGQVSSIDSVGEQSAVSGDLDGVVRRWDLLATSAPRELQLSSASLIRCAFHPDGQRAHIADIAGEVFAVNLQPIALSWTAHGASPVLALRSIEHDQVIAVTRDGLMNSYSDRDGSIIQSTSLGGRIDAAALSSDGSFVVVALESELRGIDRVSGNVRWRCEVAAKFVDELALSHDDSMIAAAEFRKPIELIDANTGHLVRTITFDRPRMGIAFASDSASVWTCMQDGKFELVSTRLSDGARTPEFGELPDAGRLISFATHAPRATVHCADGSTILFEPGERDHLLRINGTPNSSTIPYLDSTASRLLLLRLDGVIECVTGE
jgi:serine/threonine protein kinase/WD40 repeat protein